MTNPNKRKGDWAEREASAVLTELLGTLVVRNKSAGIPDDVGDHYGIYDTVVQTAWWPKKGPLRAVRQKPEECEQQRLNAGATFAFSMVRLNGGIWRAVLTPEQMATYVRETTNG